MGLFSAVAGAVSGGLTGVGSLIQNKKNRDYQKALNQKIFEREDTAYQRAVSDARSAGFSPLVAAGTSSGGVGGTVSAPPVDSSGDMLQSVVGSIAQIVGAMNDTTRAVNDTTRAVNDTTKTGNDTRRTATGEFSAAEVQRHNKTTESLTREDYEHAWSMSEKQFDFNVQNATSVLQLHRDELKNSISQSSLDRMQQLVMHRESLKNAKDLQELAHYNSLVLEEARELAASGLESQKHMHSLEELAVKNKAAMEALHEQQRFEKPYKIAHGVAECANVVGSIAAKVLPILLGQ